MQLTHHHGLPLARTGELMGDRFGQPAFNAFGLLMAFAGTLIHDGWRPYRELACQHGRCHAHHRRALTDVFEQRGQTWAKGLIDLLLAAGHEVAAVGAPLSTAHIAYYRRAYDQILATGEAANPRAPKVKQKVSGGFRTPGGLDTFRTLRA